MTTLHDMLADLAEGAPPSGPRTDLWDRGIRRHRRRRAASVAAVVAAVALVAGVGGAVRLSAEPPRPAPPVDVPFDQLHLPKTVYPPSRWAPGTDEDGPLGPLAVLGTATRAVPDGPASGSDDIAVFGVSAADGSVRWLDLPEGTSDSRDSTRLTLSPDGTKVAVGVEDADALSGWIVYDATTGKTLQLRDPERQRIAGAGTFEIQFSGDSRYLETSYSPTGSNSSRDNQLVVWDVETGERIVAEGAGHFWLPSLGSAPTGIVWSRKADTLTFDPATGKTATRTAATDRLAEWSDGPGGLSAYIDRGERDRDPWRLFSGDGVERGHDLGDFIDIVGWRDGTTVVVEDRPTHTVRYVDVTTGRTLASQELELAGFGGSRVMNPPVFAADLWANSLVSGVRPHEYDDPRVTRSDVLRVGGPVLVLGLVGWVLWRRRVRA